MAAAYGRIYFLAMRGFALPLLCLAALSACQVFDYGPAVVAPRDGPPLNVRSLARISAAPGEPRLRGKIAVLADVHQSYDELRDAIASVNADTSIAFAVLAGDLTQYGYAGEFRILSRILSGLRVPAFAGIGNHDQQAEGIGLFANFFGPTDFAFAWRGYLFVFFDDNGRITPRQPTALGLGGRRARRRGRFAASDPRRPFAPVLRSIG